MRPIALRSFAPAACSTWSGLCAHLERSGDCRRNFTNPNGYAVLIWSLLFTWCLDVRLQYIRRCFAFIAARCSSRWVCVQRCCNVSHMRALTVHPHRQLVKRVLECWWTKEWKSRRHLCHPRVHMHFMQLHKCTSKGISTFFSSFPFDLNTHDSCIFSWSEWIRMAGVCILHVRWALCLIAIRSGDCMFGNAHLQMQIFISFFVLF